jgi:transposase
MPQKNRYLRHARVSEVKLRQVLKYFCADLTAVQAAELGGLNRKTVLRLYTLFRGRMALLAANEGPFVGEVEVDESYFGANRVRGRRGRGAGRKTPVFGRLERGGRVHTQIVRNCSKTTLQAIILGRIDPAASILSDGWRL